VQKKIKKGEKGKRQEKGRRKIKKLMRQRVPKTNSKVQKFRED
jgi:hypothetical protein